jgi:hypothetical protein
MDQAGNSDAVTRNGKSGVSGSMKKAESANADTCALRPPHQRILDAFMIHGTMTRSVFYTRPRCSELRAMGLLHPRVKCVAIRRAD